jgi:hypothetical protein
MSAKKAGTPWRRKGDSTMLLIVSAAIVVANIVCVVAAIVERGEDSRFEGDKIIYRS